MKENDALPFVIEVSEFFDRAAEILGLQLCKRAKAQICHYNRILNKYNPIEKTRNLKHKYQLMLKRIIDSLSLYPLIRIFRSSSLISRTRIMDVGAGLGFPSVVLSIVLPNICFVLSEISEKKTNFLHYTAKKLSLKNLTLLNKNNDWNPNDTDIIISEALAKVLEIIKISSNSVGKSHLFFLLKGSWPLGEVLTLIKSKGIAAISVVRNKALTLHKRRHILLVKTKGMLA